MLVLSRKENEVIFLGPDIKITIVDIDRGRVRVGIEAPASLRIARGELGPPVCRKCYGRGCQVCNGGRTDGEKGA
jgi:carbon storage regulator